MKQRLFQAYYFTALRATGRVFVLCALTLAGIACTSYRDEPSDSLALSAPQNGYQALTYKHLPANRQVRLAVDRHDQSIDLDGGKSFVEALVLPRMPIPYRIDLQTEVQTAGDARGQSVFLPSLTFLDSTKQPIRTVNEMTSRYRAHTLKSPIIRSAMTIGNDLAHARYLLVHTDPANSGYSMAIRDSASRLKSGNFSTMVYAPVSPARYRVDFGEEGWVNLRVSPSVKQPRIQRKPKQKKERFRWLKGLFS